MNVQEFSNLFDDDGPRGLERLSSRLHAIRRQRHLQEVKHVVFLEQARQNIANQKNSELLARQAEYASRNSRAFANLLGMGDAWAVANSQPEHEYVAASSATAATAVAVGTRTIIPLGRIVTGGSSREGAAAAASRTTATTSTTLQEEDDKCRKICTERIVHKSHS